MITKYIAQYPSRVQNTSGETATVEQLIVAIARFNSLIKESDFVNTMHNTFPNTFLFFENQFGFIVNYKRFPGHHILTILKVDL